MGVKAAAIQVLRQAGTPLHVKDITEQIMAAGLWESGGKTPDATVSARLYQSRAERDAAAYRNQIVLEAIREARQLGSRSYSSVLPDVLTSSAPKKPSAQYTKEAQQFLTDLGYDPGLVDGDRGCRTADAVKTFQRDAGITQDGWIDEDFLSALRRVANQRSSIAPPGVKLMPAQEKRKSTGIPANAGFLVRTATAMTGYRKVANKHKRVFPF